MNFRKLFDFAKMVKIIDLMDHTGLHDRQKIKNH